MGRKRKVNKTGDANQRNSTPIEKPKGGLPLWGDFGANIGLVL